jgi:Bacterial archaeo-eukaryotic release factor family 2
METAQEYPRGTVRAPELAEVAQAEGPFATVYLSTEGDVEQAAQRSEVRWRTLRGELAEAGAPEEVLAAVDPVVPGAHQEGPGLGVVAAGAGTLHVEHGPTPPLRDAARWAGLPSLLPILRWRQSHPAHVLVLADRLGADLMVFRYGAGEERLEVDGQDYQITKSAPGGWSQRRYQQRAEGRWEQNANLVADRLVRLVRRVDPGVVAVAGDVRAVSLLKEALPPEVLELVEEVPGSRAEDGSDDATLQDVAELLRAAEEHDTARLVERWREEMGQHDLATDGPGATLLALASAQVDTLLVAEDPDDERTAWFGPGPTQVAARRDDLLAMGVDRPAEGRLVDAAVRAALGSGAGVRVIDPEAGPAEGVGALLRWATDTA